ncbi:MAG: hypothetical protein IJS88_03260 [Alphaproteobacteria bacterium]|nr:hypothetical protein [Alphaproteobacteria bacterium]
MKNKDSNSYKYLKIKEKQAFDSLLFVLVILGEICLAFEFGRAALSAAVTRFLNSPRVLSLSLLIKKTSPLAVKTTF